MIVATTASATVVAIWGGLRENLKKWPLATHILTRSNLAGKNIDCSTSESAFS